jgi:hypothetical protein
MSDNIKTLKKIETPKHDQPKAGKKVLTIELLNEIARKQGVSRRICPK